jgi:hypothetical protein
MTFLVLAAAIFAPPPAPGGLTAAVGKDTITYTDGDKVVTVYKFAGTVREAKSDKQKPLAKPYFYPLTAPNGVAVTRPWPIERTGKPATTDHFHQKSAWFCHGDVIPEGIDLKTKDRGIAGVDFWAEGPKKGRIVHTGWVGTPGTEFTETTEWVTPDGVKLLDGVRKLTLAKTAVGYLILWDIELKANVYKIYFGDTKEGSMGIRIRDDFTLNSKTGKSGVVTSSDGQTFRHGARDNLPIWGRPADWNDYSGTADGQTAGVAIFDHPQNKPRADWHTRAYGLMAANPFGRSKSGFPSQKGKENLARIDKGGSLKLKYALYIHNGDAKAGKVAEVYEAFAK